MLYSNDLYETLRRRFAGVELTEDQLHLYQEDAHDFLYDNPFSALFIDMGLGKTIISLTLAVRLLSEFKAHRILVIAPLRVANTTWPNEIRLWEHTAGYDFTVLTGSADERTTALSEGTQRNCPIFIINREQIEWLANIYLDKWPFDTVIVDESSSLKDHKTKRFNALKNVRRYIKRLHELTATPAAETYLHLFAQIYLLDQGKRLGKDMSVFQDKYFTYNHYSRKFKLRPGAEEEIVNKISDICLVMKREDYLEFQQPVFHNVMIDMSSKQEALYKTMATEFIVELDNGVEVEAETAAALSSKLLQMASGVLYDTVDLEDATSGDVKKLKKVYELHRHKIDELERIYEEAQGEPILVSYHFKSSLDRLKKAFPKAVAMDREGKAVAQWNKRKIPMLLVHPQSAGHGLNLQKGGHHIVFYDIPWSLELYLQLIGRLDRQGQQHPVIVQHLICRNTLDTLVIAALMKKNDAQDALFRMLKRARSKLKKDRAAKIDLAAEAFTDDDEL